MIDLGLAMSLVASLGIASVLARWFPPTVIGARAVLDTSLPGLMVGALVGRAAGMALSSSGVGPLKDFLVLRGGVEFWAGLAAGAATLAVASRRRRASPTLLLADLAPYGLAACGVYQAMCLVREGCYGPRTAVGLTPPGTTTSMFPVEIATGALLLAAAFLLRHSWGLRPRAVLSAAVGLLALARLAGAGLLPTLDGRWARPTVESLAALAFAAMALTGEALAWRSRRRLLGHVAPAPGDEPHREAPRCGRPPQWDSYDTPS